MSSDLYNYMTGVFHLCSKEFHLCDNGHHYGGRKPMTIGRLLADLPLYIHMSIH